MQHHMGPQENLDLLHIDYVLVSMWMPGGMHIGSVAEVRQLDQRRIETNVAEPRSIGGIYSHAFPDFYFNDG